MKTYIGDGIYAELDDQGLILTTENGVAVTNRIVIEPREWDTLNEWLGSQEGGRTWAEADPKVV